MYIYMFMYICILIYVSKHDFCLLVKYFWWKNSCTNCYIEWHLLKIGCILYINWFCLISSINSIIHQQIQVLVPQNSMVFSTTSQLGGNSIPWIFWKIATGFEGKYNLGGGNSNIYYFHPEPWGNDPIWRAYFSNGLEPPTSNVYTHSFCWS